MVNHRFIVWPENWEAVQVFLHLTSDWITPGGFGGGYRLPTTEIESAMRIWKVKDRRECWLKLQHMKAHAAGLLTRRREDAHATA